MKYQKLFEPVQFGNLTLPNRFAMCAMGPAGMGDFQGGYNQRGIDYYVERAKGGTGLIITGVSHACNDIEIHPLPFTPSPTVNPAHFIETAREMTERVHAYGSLMFLQLSAGFGRVYGLDNAGLPTVSASAVENFFSGKPCRPLDVDEIHHITESMAKSAAIAKRAGFDGVQIHAVHEGYLLDQFAVELFNQRTDQYGGSLENRLRFAREVVEAIKGACCEDFHVSLRYSVKSFIKDIHVGGLPGEEFVEKGKDVAEGIEAAKLLAGYGYDSLDVDVGCYDAWFWSHPPMYQEKGLYREYAKMVKDAVSVPVICAGRMDDPDMAQAAIEDGVCDVIGLARPLLADPFYVNKLRKDDILGIRPCLSCHEGCMGRMVTYGSLSCAVNPSCARERVSQLVPTREPKRVMVAGGGPAGMEAARVLKLRGHEPVLFEASDQLGGNLVPGGKPKFKEDDRRLVAWYVEQLRRLGVEVRLNTAARVDDAEGFDCVIVATGSRPKVFDLDGVQALVAEDVLNERVGVEDDVAIIGGGLVGCELALHLAYQGKRVTVVEQLDDILKANAPLCPSNTEMLWRLLDFNGVNVVRSTRAVGYEDGCLIVETDGGEQIRIKAGSVVECVGYASNNSLYEDLRFVMPELYCIGDSKKVANIMNAIWEAFELASNL